MSTQDIIEVAVAVCFIMLLSIAYWVQRRAKNHRELLRDIHVSLQEIYGYDKRGASIDIEKGLLILPGPFGELRFNIEKAPNGKWRIYVDTANFSEHRVLAPEHFARQLAAAKELEGFYTPMWEKAETPPVAVLTEVS